LSIGRDGYLGENPGELHSYADLVGFLNQLNADWVKAARRLSPAVLIDLLEHTSAQVTDYYRTLDPDVKAIFPVSWAGETESQNWFDLAREYTERWHHQQQIRMAVNAGDNTLLAARFYRPLLETFMRALPHTYREVPAPDGTTVLVEVPGDNEARWLLRRQDDQWELDGCSAGVSPHSDSHVIIPATIAWQIFTKALSKHDARKLVTIHGDEALGARVLEMVSVMA
jgi:hypothetical protein